MDVVNGIIDSIRRLKQRCTVEDEIGQPFNLTPREMSALLSVQPGERLGCNDLAERVGLSPSRGSRIIASLIEKGYLLRGESGEDRRCVLVSLSPRGEECRRGLLTAELECERRLLAGMTEDQVRQVEAGIRILLNVLEEGAWVR